MASFSLPFPTSNNAPLPIPGGYGNPTGANTHGFGPGGGGAFPSIPLFGSPSYNVGAFGTGQGIAGLSSGFSTNDPGRTQDLYNYLGSAYGKGPGQLIGNMITQGLFNPQIAAAFLNAQAPGISRGEAGIQSSFADAGARFSSAAALGLGDFESQVQLNQQQTLASLFENAQSQQLGLLENVLPTIHQERANQGSWTNDLLGGLEILGGAIAAPFSGGASLELLTSGIGSLMGANNPTAGASTGGGGNSQAGLLNALQQLFNQNSTAKPDLSGTSMGESALGNMSALSEIIALMQGSGASALGGESLGIPTTMPGVTYH
jgi:hypothetical protein